MNFRTKLKCYSMLHRLWLDFDDAKDSVENNDYTRGINYAGIRRIIELEQDIEGFTKYLNSDNNE